MVTTIMLLYVIYVSVTQPGQCKHSHWHPVVLQYHYPSTYKLYLEWSIPEFKFYLTLLVFLFPWDIKLHLIAWLVHGACLLQYLLQKLGELWEWGQPSPGIAQWDFGQPRDDLPNIEGKHEVKQTKVKKQIFYKMTIHWGFTN